MKKLLFALVVLCSFGILQAGKCFCHNCKSCHADNGKVVCKVNPDKNGCCSGQLSNNIKIDSKCCKCLENKTHDISWSELKIKYPVASQCPQ